MIVVTVLIITALGIGLILVIAKQLRDDIRSATEGQGAQTLNTVVTHLTRQQQLIEIFSNQVMTLNTTFESRMTSIRDTIEKKLTDIQTDNGVKLDQMRATVDEKLQTTLEKRLGETYNLMSERLEMVHKGLGEMQQLAQGVGDLKRVLTNVKTRGTWGEVQLAALLEQVMVPDQYSKNVKIVPNNNEFVDFAIKLPGKTDHDVVWLPIDSKFPQDAYHRLVLASEEGSPDAIEAAKKLLDTALKTQAKSISQKYIHPPFSTDFAIMFLPTEGLFAEALRLEGVQDILQSQYRVIIAGPTTLAAIMSSLQLGFKTLAIEKRTGEVWQLLSVIQGEFGKFGALLEKTQKKLHEAGQTIEDATRKTRTIERRLDKLSTQYDPTLTGTPGTPLFELTPERGNYDT
ncbi:DNA recombination protein RmuC [bacterium]|nr:DNA recombination protein RmuC [bacterium]